MQLDRAGRWPAVWGLAGVLVASGAASGCGTATPVEARAVRAGRYVLVGVPYTVSATQTDQSQLLADTLWLAAGGDARQVQVLHSVISHDYLGQTPSGTPGEFTRAYSSAGVWQPAQADGQVVNVVADSGRVLLQLRARADGGVETTSPGRVYARQ